MQALAGSHIMHPRIVTRQAHEAFRFMRAEVAFGAALTHQERVAGELARYHV